MINLTQYLIALRMDKNFYFEDDKNQTKNVVAQSIPFVHIIDIIRTNFQSYDDIKFPKLENLVKKLTPVELSSTKFIFTNESIISVINGSYPIALASKIGELFDVRKEDNSFFKVSLKNKYPDQNYYNYFKNGSSSLVWKSYSINVYQRPYYSNKYWKQEGFKLLKQYILTGETKKINLINGQFATQLNLIKPSVKLPWYFK